MKIVWLVAAGLLGWQLGTADAKPEEVVLSTTITLLEETPIYGSPDNTMEPVAALAPQDVRIIGAESGWHSARNATDLKWFKTRTWMGEQWVHLELQQLGSLRQTDMYLWLKGETALFDSPFGSRHTGLALSPQTVRVVAVYQSKLLRSYLVETWAGPKWIMEAERPFFPVTPINEKIELTTASAKFAAPVPDDGGYGVWEPQTVTAYEQYSGGWYHVRTASGETAWVNRKFSEPEGVMKTDESIEVKAVTPLRKYPYAYEINMGAIAPQTVKAYEKWVSPEGEQWFHIRSWQGNAWIRPVTNQSYLSEEVALKAARQLDSTGNPKWTAAFQEDFVDPTSRERRPVWVVTAEYPFGNKMIVYIDAVTGGILALTETEPL